MTQRYSEFHSIRPSTSIQWDITHLEFSSFTWFILISAVFDIFWDQFSNSRSRPSTLKFFFYSRLIINSLNWRKSKLSLGKVVMETHQGQLFSGRGLKNIIFDFSDNHFKPNPASTNNTWQKGIENNGDRETRPFCGNTLSTRGMHPEVERGELDKIPFFHISLFFRLKTWRIVTGWSERSRV